MPDWIIQTLVGIALTYLANTARSSLAELRQIRIDLNSHTSAQEEINESLEDRVNRIEERLDSNSLS